MENPRNSCRIVSAGSSSCFRGEGLSCLVEERGPTRKNTGDSEGRGRMLRKEGSGQGVACFGCVNSGQTCSSWVSVVNFLVSMQRNECHGDIFLCYCYVLFLFVSSRLPLTWSSFLLTSHIHTHIYCTYTCHTCIHVYAHAHIHLHTFTHIHIHT